MNAFVTVGSTGFSALVNAVLSNEFLKILAGKGYNTLVVQCGNSEFEFCRYEVTVEVYKYKPSLEADIKAAQLVIGHAGSGTIIDSLRLGKHLIVVPNPTLAGNHQKDIATAMATLGYLVSTPVENLLDALKEFDKHKLKPFPPFDGTRFPRIVDECMGLI